LSSKAAKQPALSNRQLLLKETKATLALALPLVGTQLSIMAMSVTDTIMAGRLSTVDLGAVALGSAIYVPIFLLNLGIILGITPVVAQHHGAKRHSDVNAVFMQGLYLSVMLSAISWVLLKQTPLLLASLDIDTELAKRSGDYLGNLILGLPAIYAFLSLRFVATGVGNVMPVLLILGVGVFLNGFLNWAFMYGNLGINQMGAAGCGLATALVYVAVALSLLAHMLLSNHYQPYHFRLTLPPLNPAILKEILHIGLPNGLSSFMEVALFASVALAMGTLGETPIAAHSVALNIAALAFMIPVGLSIAATTRVAHAAGKGDLCAIKHSAYAATGLAIVIMSLTSITLFLFPHAIATVYTNAADVQELAAKLIVLAAIFQVWDGIQVTMLGALRGLKDTRVPMVNNFIAYWGVGLTTGYLFGIQYDYGPEGLWAGLIAGLATAAVFHCLRFYRQTKAMSENIIEG